MPVLKSRRICIQFLIYRISFSQLTLRLVIHQCNWQYRVYKKQFLCYEVEIFLNAPQDTSPGRWSHNALRMNMADSCSGVFSKR